MGAAQCCVEREPHHDGLSALAARRPLTRGCALSCGRCGGELWQYSRRHCDAWGFRRCCCPEDEFASAVAQRPAGAGEVWRPVRAGNPGHGGEVLTPPLCGPSPELGAIQVGEMRGRMLLRFPHAPAALARKGNLAEGQRI
eukprot:TRINITY_DN28990_c0_g1_i2.p1 TRINITY_DN28990_c0_g1~~TRINITY_DN28990_c0_g1_i2.p1  ORF type:complete len:141 (+),score=8.59 TRINITY_DN28990_c0_g1_i2:116-538(+)